MPEELVLHKHLGAFIRENVIPQGMSVTDAAKQLGVGRPALSNLLNGNSSLSPNMAIKLEKAFGADRQELLNLQVAFNHHDKEKEKSVTARTYVPPFLNIKARQIHIWADIHEARQLLPVLLRRLIHSTGHDLHQVDFPGHDNAERHGWDGMVEAGTPTPWIPAGKSCWEFGASKNPLRKAEDDYSARTNSTPLTERQECTFVFISPRNWPGKSEWVKKKRAEGDWKEVKALDASDLEQWLEESIPAQIWFAEQLSIPTEGFRTLDQFWQRWTSASTPHLSPLLFESAIAAHRATFINWLKNPSERPLTVAADSKDEALAFLACLFRNPDISSQSENLAVIFESVQTLRSLAPAKSPFIPIVKTDDVEQELADIRTRFHCIAVRPRNTVDSKPDITLGQLDDEALKNALTSMGFEDSEIKRVARKAGHSPTILRRQLSNIEAIRKPQWANNTEIARDLIPMALVGAWHSGSNADCEILSTLADNEYRDIEKAVAQLLIYDDCPIWCIRRYRGVTSKIDALFAIGYQVTKSDLDHFFFIAEYVLSESDPALDLPEGTRWAAGLYGKVRNHSQAIRESICETLVILSIHGNHLFQERLGIDIEDSVSSLIEKLLTPFTLDNLLSHNSDLPHYAEAAPDRFLSLLEADLKKTEPAVLGLLRPAQNALFGGCPRVGLLWALECLAWKNLHRVNPILAKLSRISIDDNWTNKPIASLEAIHRFWIPQTTAPLMDRIKSLEVLVRQFPDVGWQICVAQLNTGRQVGTYSHRPRWRNDASGADQPASKQELNTFRRKALDLVLEWPSQYDWKKLSDLIERISGMPNADQIKAWNKVDAWVANKNTSDADKAKLREKIRRFAFTYLGQWRALDDATKNRIQKAYKSLQPNDLVIRHAWLFASHLAALPNDNSRNENQVSLEENEKRVRKSRINAMKEIWAKYEFNGVIKLLSNNSISEVVGSILAQTLKDTEECLKFLQQCLSITDRLERNIDICTQGLLSTIDNEKCKAILTAVSKDVDTGSFIRLMKCAPFRDSTWRLLDQCNKETQNQYWQEVVPSWGRHDESELVEIIDRLLDVQRACAAFDAVHLYWPKIETSRLKRLLFATAKSAEYVTHRIEPYQISEALNSLDERMGVSSEEMAQLEFLYIDALELSEHGIPNLERQLAQSPDLFMQVLALAYPYHDHGKDPTELRTEDSEKHSRLTWSALCLLDQIKHVPGSKEDNRISAETLSDWITEVRSLCAEHDRVEIGDQVIGQILSRAPAGEDGIHPNVSVCEVMEKIASDHIAEGFIIGVRNQREDVWRGSGEEQERELVVKYRNWAKQRAFDHPYVSRVLENIASSYEQEAAWWDAHREIENRLHQ